MWAASFCGALIISIASVHAQRTEPLRFNLVPASSAMQVCMPNASADITVFPKEDIRGVDTLDLKANGLQSNTTFVVFLTELPVAPFGAVQYIGDFTTNPSGNGSLRVDTIVQEAFSSKAGASVVNRA